VLVTGNHWLLDIAGSFVVVPVAAAAATLLATHRPASTLHPSLPAPVNE
jgi:hypothetical protein